MKKVVSHKNKEKNTLILNSPDIPGSGNEPYLIKL